MKTSAGLGTTMFSLDEVACGEIVSTDQYVEEKIDEEHEAMNSSQDEDVVAGVSGVQDVSIQGSSTGQDVEDMKFSSSKGVLEENFRRKENDVEVIPVASKEDLENNSVKLENAGLNLSGMDAEPDMSDLTTQNLKLLGKRRCCSHPAKTLHMSVALIYWIIRCHMRCRVLLEKLVRRKFHDEVGGASKEPTKRPRRWNIVTLKTAEPQNSSGALSKN